MSVLISPPRLLTALPAAACAALLACGGVSPVPVEVSPLLGPGAGLEAHVERYAASALRSHGVEAPSFTLVADVRSGSASQASGASAQAGATRLQGRVTLSGPCAGQRVEAQASAETSFALGADRGAAERAAASALLERTIDDAVASWSRRCEEGDGDT